MEEKKPHRRPAPLIDKKVSTLETPCMPLDVMRLRNSDLAVLANGEAFKAAVLLWCAAWHQTPPASLPNDDRILQALSLSNNWDEIKSMALHGFIECSDGRLYHPLIAEYVMIKVNELNRLKARRRQQSQWMKNHRQKQGKHHSAADK